MAEHVVIIGSGPAGFAAAIYAARANLQPVLFEGNAALGNTPLGQLAMTTEVENYPGFPSGLLDTYINSAVAEEHKWMLPPLEAHPHAVTGPELMNLMRQQALNFGTRIITDDVVEVQFGKRPFVVTPSENPKLEAHTIIIATGAKANYLGLPSEDSFKNRGVSACAVCDGALPRFRNKPLLVVGGGDSAVEEATYLSKYASVVHLLIRRDVLRASKIMQERAITNPKIQIEKFTEVDEVLGNDKEGVTSVRVKNNQTNEKREIACSGLFLAIGHTPNTSFLQGQLALNEKGYIKLTTGFRTYTSVEGVFAAGDVADDYYRQAITSAGTGCMAALDAERYLAAHGI
jgi:thioredoxin reductase (NADPH)